MQGYLSSIDETCALQQGDIIRRFCDPVTQSNAQWGFVLNADCDLANRKNQGHISWIEVVTVRHYWEKYWAAQQLSTLVEKQAKKICDQLNSILKKKEFDLSEVTPEKLKDWVQYQSANEIVESIGSRNEKLVKSIEAFSLAKGDLSNVNALDVLGSCQRLFGQEAKKNCLNFRKSILRQDGFPDFFLVPNLPEGDSKGYVLLLRKINGTDEGAVFKSLADARINDVPEAFHRIGRFSDGVRFQIVQKLAFLFLRIGSSSEYESECEQAVDWMIEAWGED